MSFYASLILFTNVSCSITSDIQPEPQQPSLRETGIEDAADDPEDHNEDGSTTGDESDQESETSEDESDQESETSEDDTMTADEEDVRKLPATAGAGQSMSETCPTNILLVSAQDHRSGMCFFSLGEDLIYLWISDPQEATELVTINQTHFTVNTIPSRRGGRARRTRDMAELFVCICGSRVEDQERVVGSNTALRCGYEGCEMSWVTN